jgi:hypothetical protein
MSATTRSSALLTPRFFEAGGCRAESKRPLSPAEFDALRNIQSGTVLRISTERKAMLLGMGLVKIDDAGALAVTDMGELRLRQMEDDA